MTQQAANKLSIRPMRKSDVKSTARLIRALAAHFGDKAGVKERDLLTYCFGRHKLADILLARVAGKPGGVAITRDWMNFYLGVKFRHIDFIFVDPAYRGCGIGLSLMKAAANGAHATGCRCLSLHVGAGNKKADKLYRRLGFKRAARNTKYYRLKDEGLLRLARMKE
jgi:ribosomal protein S18 acetylase RimI-like enzyme